MYTSSSRLTPSRVYLEVLQHTRILAVIVAEPVVIVDAHIAVGDQLVRLASRHGGLQKGCGSRSGAVNPHM